MTDAFIPVNTPDLDGNEKAYLIQCIESGWISSEGPFVEKFECAMAERVGRRHGVAVANGSVALDAAVVALDIGPGDEVIVPTFTIISCVSQIVRQGAIPVTVDCDPLTWNMIPEEVAAAVTPRTKAIMVVHIYGLPVDIDPILEIAEKHGLAVIEDAAEMHGQTYKGRPCGSFGALSTFSFYPNKHVTTGEGGMVLTDDDNLARRLRSLRNLCFGSRRFVHEELGWNWRMTNLQAAVGLAQLERLDDFIVRKRRMGALYDKLLCDLDQVQRPVPATDYARNVYWVYGVVLGEELHQGAEMMMEQLSRAQVGTRPFFYPLHEQPVLRRMGLFEGVTHPVAEYIARRGFYLPSGLGLSQSEMERAASSLRRQISRDA